MSFGECTARVKLELTDFSPKNRIMQGPGVVSMHFDAKVFMGHGVSFLWVKK